MQESFKFYKEGYKQEISFTWKANEHHNEQVDQTIQLFSSVNEKISKHECEPLKMNVIFLFYHDFLLYFNYHVKFCQISYLIILIFYKDNIDAFE